MEDHGIGADAGPVTDGDWAEDLGATTNEDIAAQAWTQPLLRPNRHLMLDEHTRTPTHGTVDDHSVRMDQDQAWPKLSTPPDNATERHVELVERHLQRSQSSMTGCLHKPVDHHRRRAVGHQGLGEITRAGTLIGPLSLGTNIVTYGPN